MKKLFVQNVSSVRHYHKKKRAAVTFMILSAVSEHLKAGRTRPCYVRQLNIRRKENGEYHDLIQEMRLIVLHYKREFQLATSLQFFSCVA